MHSSLRVVALSAALSALVAGSALAGAVAPGEYKLAVGHATPCTVTLAADGTADVAACTAARDVAHWRQNGSTVEFSHSNGEVYGLLNAQGDSFVGSTISTNDKLTLTPSAQTASATH